MEKILADVSGSGVCRASRTSFLALQIRASTCQQFQDVVGQAAHAEAVRLSPRTVVRRPQLVRVERSLLGRLGKDDRLGEVVVVRVADCRRDLGDAVRVRFGDLPSRPTSCMTPRNWTGAMPAMRRRARRFTSFARTDTAVPRKQGGGRCSNAKGSGSAPYVHPTRADATEDEVGVRP